MRAHSFWEPLFYDLQLHPDWNKKYAAQYEGASGDAIAPEAVKLYRQRHNLVHNKDDYMKGDERGILKMSTYERYVRDAYIEFVLNDPWYVVQLKYYNALTVIDSVGEIILRNFEAIGWPFLLLAISVATALVIQVRQKQEALETLALAAGVLALTAVLVAGPVWAMLVNANLMSDLLVFAGTASFVVALSAIVAAGVSVSKRLAGLERISRPVPAE
jgi:hypothetical protein